MVLRPEPRSARATDFLRRSCGSTVRLDHPAVGGRATAAAFVPEAHRLRPRQAPRPRAEAEPYGHRLDSDKPWYGMTLWRSPTARAKPQRVPTASSRRDETQPAPGRTETHTCETPLQTLENATNCPGLKHQGVKELLTCGLVLGDRHHPRPRLHYGPLSPAATRSTTVTVILGRLQRSRHPRRGKPARRDGDPAQASSKTRNISSLRHILRWIPERVRG